MISSRALDESALAVGDAEPAHRGGRAELDPQVVQQLRDCRSHRLPVDGAEASARMAAREDVLRHGQIGKDRRLLVHRDDPEPVGVVRAADPLGLAVDEQPSVVGVHHPGEDLHECRLARAVLADERMHGACLDREADVVEGLDAAVALRDPDQLDERAHRGYAAVTPPSTLITFPVDFAERGPARKAIASATSSGKTLTPSFVRPR
jgi:hypothetical protein